MLEWQVGAVRIRRLVEIEQVIPYDPALPFMAEARPEALAAIQWLHPHFVTAEGAIRLSIHTLLVEAPGLRLLVDTCVGNDRRRDFLAPEPLDTPFLAHLAAAGWPPETVDMVVCTHLHADHVGWNTRLVDGAWVPTFPNARYLIGRAEYEYYAAHAEGEQRAVLDDAIEPIRRAGLVELVEPDHRLCPEIRLFPTPGHTPGHVSLRIESDGAAAIITGDAIHHPSQMAHPAWSPPWDFDRQQSFASRCALLTEAADAAVLVIGTHFAAPTAGRVRRDGAAYRFEV